MFVCEFHPYMLHLCGLLSFALYLSVVLPSLSGVNVFDPHHIVSHHNTKIDW